MEPDSGGTAADFDIVRQVRGGDTEAFGRLVDRHRDRVFAVAGRHVPRDSVAEIAQEVFLDAFRSLGGFKQGKSFEGWLTRIAVRRCHDYWRARYRKREVPMSQLEGGGEELLREGSIGEEGDGRSMADLRELLDRLLDRLPPDDRLVLTLVHFEERSVRETAGLLGWSESKVKVRAHRARRRLRGFLNERCSERGGVHG